MDLTAGSSGGFASSGVKLQRVPSLRDATKESSVVQVSELDVFQCCDDSISSGRVWLRLMQESPWKAIKARARNIISQIAVDT